MNNVTLLGRLTATPEIRTTSSGKEYTNFTLAVDRRKGKDGTRSADFIDCVAWNHTAKAIADWCEKGRKILVEGSLRVENYEKDGQKRRSVRVLVNEIEFVDSNKRTENASSAPAPAPAPAEEETDLDLIIDEEDLPF